MKRYILIISLVLFAGSVWAAGGSVTYKVNGVDYEGYYASPEKDAPLVLMVHDWDGLTDYEVKRVNMLYDLGYAVFAIDMFGKGMRPTEVADKKKLTGALYKDRAKMRALLNGALDAAAAQGGNINNAVTIGYCFGGSVALEFARSGAPMKGFVSFHGGLATPEGQDYKSTNGSILIIHGSADKVVPMSQFAALTEELETSGIDHEMITYSGARHAFSVIGSQRYHEEADKKSWQRFRQYLAQTL